MHSTGTSSLRRTVTPMQFVASGWGDRQPFNSPFQSEISQLDSILPFRFT